MRIAATLVTLCGLVAQQTAPPPQQQQRPPVFRGESVLVTVDAYPQRDGRIVEGLKAEDFQVLEDGKPQAVETVEFVRVEPVLSESERRDPNSVREMLVQVADPHNRVFVVMLDRGNVSLDGSHASRRPLVDALNRIIGERDLFALTTPALDPRALTFGRRLISIEEQLTKYWTWGVRNSLLSDPSDPMEAQLHSCFATDPRSGAPWLVDDSGQPRELYRVLWDRRREDRTLSALEGVIDRLAATREARTVAIVVTEGWRLFGRDQGLANQAGAFGPMPAMPVGVLGGRLTTGDQVNLGRSTANTIECIQELGRLANLEDDRRLRDIVTRANRANVSFYPINPAGLTTFDTPISEKYQPSLEEDGRRLRRRAEGLHDLALATDGIAIVNTNDLASGLKRIVDDVSAYYLLGYYSTNPTHDGRYRRIEVKAKTPGLTVRARRGYFAPSSKPARPGLVAPPAGPEPPKGLEEALGEVSRLRGTADVYLRGGIAADRAVVAVELASTRAGASPWMNGADVQVIVTPEGAAPLAAVTARIEANSRGALVSVPFDAAAPAVARVVAKISAGGESVEETAQIKQSDGGLVGDAVLYRGRPAATSPLRPVADLQFRRTERVHVEWALTGEIDQRSARLLSRNGQPMAIPVAVTERETDGRKVVAADLNLAPLTAGEFVIELTVGRGAETVTRLVAFRIVP